MLLRTLALGVLLIGCSSNGASPSKTVPAPSGAPAPSTPVPAPAPAPDPAPADAPTTGPAIGETCGPSDTCAAGLECIRYYGIAGARGPQFKSCELRCSDTAPCPDGKRCNTIADGPGQVCR
jgi:hypothetical protein